MNAVPHLVIAATGRRNLTPFGRDSSPGVNLHWSGINFASGYLFVRFADRRAGENKANAKAWLVPYEMGRFCWSLFGVLYALFTAGVKEQRPKKPQMERPVGGATGGA